MNKPDRNISKQVARLEDEICRLKNEGGDERQVLEALGALLGCPLGESPSKWVPEAVKALIQNSGSPMSIPLVLDMVYLDQLIAKCSDAEAGDLWASESWREVLGFLKKHGMTVPYDDTLDFCGLLFDELRKIHTLNIHYRMALQKVGEGSCCETPGCCEDDPKCDVMIARAALQTPIGQTMEIIHSEEPRIEDDER